MKCVVRIILSLFIINILPALFFPISEKLRVYTVSQSYLSLKGPISLEVLDVIKEIKSEGKLVKRTGIRPIFIYVKELSEDSPLGYATPLINLCFITLNKKYVDTASKRDIKNLIIHELLHCHFYDHDVYSDSIMYPYMFEKDYNKSIDVYYRNLNK